MTETAAWIPFDDDVLPCGPIAVRRSPLGERAPHPCNWSRLARTFWGIPDVWLLLSTPWGSTRATAAPELLRHEEAIAEALRGARELERSACGQARYLLCFATPGEPRVVVNAWPFAIPALSSVPRDASILAPSPGLALAYGEYGVERDDACARVDGLPLWLTGRLPSLRAFGARLRPKDRTDAITVATLRALASELAECEEVGVGTHETFSIPNYLEAGFSDPRSNRAELAFERAGRIEGARYAAGTRSTPRELFFRFEVELPTPSAAAEFETILATWVRELARLRSPNVADAAIARRATRVSLRASKLETSDSAPSAVDAIVAEWAERGRAPVTAIEELVARSADWDDVDVPT